MPALKRGTKTNDQTPAERNETAMPAEEHSGQEHERDDVEEIEEDGRPDASLSKGATASINKLDTVCNKAIIAMCRLNVIEPPAPLKFGTWNERQLREKQAEKLAKQIIIDKFSPFSPANRLPLVIPRDKLDPSCISIDLNTETAPFLKLTETAIRTGTALTFAGGRHRVKASEILWQTSNEKTEALEAQIKKTKHSLEKNDREELRNKLSEQETTLKDEIAFRDSICVWGITVYDEGESQLIR